ncbi:hypothetical protein [Pseudomonas sp.]|uniref:hypothetical protein n=1 Tax=Pseudomonas sp. TaxID=306 RepID=UPI0028A8BF35|nr:hypothetical protein [Pseudomonas sp.]
MQYLGLGLVIGLLALMVALVALRVLLTGHWVLGWLRGMFGMLGAMLAVLVGMAAWDMTTYRPIPVGNEIANLSFQADGEQRYRMQLEEKGQSRFVTLEGDLWQLDVQVLRWSGLAALIGLEPGYRLGMLSGRYLAVEQQDQAHHPYVKLEQSWRGIDVWGALRECRCTSVMLDAQLIRGSFLPITDGARYRIELTHTGLLAKPDNAVAEQALSDW